MLREAVVSSNLAKIGYDSATVTLEVEFRPDRHGESAVFAYTPVTEAQHAELLAAPSIGRAFIALKDSPLVQCEKVGIVTASGTEVAA